MRGAPAVAGSLVAMTKPVSRDVKLKGPKESTDRALVNCASGKYLSSNQTHVPRHELGIPEQAKVQPLQVLRCSFAASRVHSLRRVRPALFFMRSAWKRLGVKSLFGKSQPVAAGSYLHANLAWHLGIVYRGPGMCVF